MRRAVVVAAAIGVAIAAGLWKTHADTARSPLEAPTTVATASAPALQGTTVVATAENTVGAAAPRPAPTEAPHTLVDGALEVGHDMLASVREAIAKETEASNAVLLRALDSDDSVAKVEAIKELVRRKHLPALSRLLKVDPADDPFMAPTALVGLGHLAREADGTSRESAVSRFAKLLDAEKTRQGADSPGNILHIIEALGNVGTPSSARLLERELVDPIHPTATRVAIVDALEACGQRSSIPALTAFRTSFHGRAQDDFEREIENDLGVSLERAIAALERR
jgi:hypothetical protein